MRGSIKRLVAFGSIATVALLTIVGVAAADTVSTSFDGFTDGSVNLQERLEGAAAIFSTTRKLSPTPFGVPGSAPSLCVCLMRQRTGEFSLQTYSKPTAAPASEDTSGNNGVWTLHFSFTSRWI